MQFLKHKHCSHHGVDACGNDTIRFSLEHRLDDPDYKCNYDPNFGGSNNMHFGQRKLLISEIYAITQYYVHHGHMGDPVVLYIGAAPGTHLMTLQGMFPRIKFILFDSARFDRDLLALPSTFLIYREYFTDETCLSIKSKLDNKTLVLISDIRRGASETGTFEDGVEEDMMLQKQWVMSLRPAISLLKYRMSYKMQAGQCLNYLGGKLLFGVWAKKTSGECRLLVDSRDDFYIKDYDYSAYEQTQAFHNRHARSFGFSEALHKYKQYIVDGRYCPCYDCFAELSVLDMYANAQIAGKLTMTDSVELIMKNMKSRKPFYAHY